MRVGIESRQVQGIFQSNENAENWICANGCVTPYIIVGMYY